MRQTKDAKKAPLYVVSAFSAECSLVLGECKIECVNGKEESEMAKKQTGQVKR
jgi:hypothetical protein